MFPNWISPRLCSNINSDHLRPLNLFWYRFAISNEIFNIASNSLARAFNTLLDSFTLGDTPWQRRNSDGIPAFFQIGFKNNSILLHISLSLQELLELHFAQTCLSQDG